MPSEKLRYISNTPYPVIDMNELKQHLSGFSSNNLIETIWRNAQSHLPLWKALNGHIGVIQSNGNLEKAKEAIDYSLHFEDDIRYSERGHDQIIYELIVALDTLLGNGEKEFAIKLAKYIHAEAEQQYDIFEDGWSWQLALEDLEKWISDHH